MLMIAVLALFPGVRDGMESAKQDLTFSMQGLGCFPVSVPSVLKHVRRSEKPWNTEVETKVCKMQPEQKGSRLQH